MNPIIGQADFHAATAATAAAAASSNTCPLHQTTMDSVESETSEGGQWSSEECGYMDGDSQRANNQSDIVPTYPQFGWVDITKDFFDSCNELSLGELAQDIMFGLLEAMSAIEMMDPKMDMGMGYNKNDKPAYTFETAVEAGVLKLENLTVEEYLGVFDSLFACIVSWLEGNSMDQVLLTCLYLHAPAKIKDKSLRSFCYAVRNLVLIIKKIVVISSVNEEEDFQYYGNLAIMSAEESLPYAVTTQIKEAEDELLRQNKNSAQPEDIMPVVHRLRYMRHFYHAIYLFDFATSTSPDEAIINEIYKNLNATLELVPQIKRTIDKGTPPEEDSDLPNPMGYSSRIHNRSQPPTFPRTVKIRDRHSSIQFYEEVALHLKHACKVIKMRDYYTVLNFFIDFSRRYGNCILSRSILQALFMSHDRLIFGTIPMKDFLWDSVRAFNSPPILNPKHALATDRKIQMHLETFFRYCASMSTFVQFIRICGYNRARQREKLSRFLESFESIQVEAARLDSHLSVLASEKAAEGNEPHATALKYSAQFSTWVHYNCFRAMMLYLMSGFELELYSVHEYIYIYWYPYELLIGFIVSALTRTENNWLVQEEYAEQLSRLQSGGNGKNRKTKPKKNKKQQKPYRQEIVYYHALLSMCGGFYKGMGALTKDGRIKQPMSQFDSEEIRYSRRFAPFQTLSSPPRIRYKEYESIREHMMRPDSSEIYEHAARHFDQARSILENMQNPDQEILDLRQVARVNFVVMNVLAKGHQKHTKKQPEFDFSTHRHFP
ncbi:N-alpha-acetyltransferase 35, NatC auxiliary subunit homolog, partial [Teleopsis dalmanni]